MTFPLSTSRLNLEFQALADRFKLAAYGIADSSWLSATSPLFAVGDTD